MKLWIAVLVLILLFLTVPFLVRTGRNPGQTEVVSNIRQIHMALFEFDNEYGKFPDVETIRLVQSKTGTSLHLGTRFSNDYFRQLLAAGIGNEKMFYARESGSRKPDDLATGGRALEKGECGFSYIPGFSSSSNSSYPLVIAGLIPGTDLFDKSFPEGRPVVVRIDGSATMAEVDREGHVLFLGKRLLDPANPIWEARKPLIVWPEPGEKPSLLRSIF